MKQLFSRYVKNLVLTISILMLLFAATKTSAQWIELGGTTGNFNINNNNGVIYSIITDAGENVYAGGQFSNTIGRHYVTKWNGIAWSELSGTNISPFNSTLNSIAIDASGNVYTGGGLKNASGTYYVAKWNGTAWSELGGANSSTFNNSIYSIATDATGNVYAAGLFTDANSKRYVAKWNGAAWSELGGTSGSFDNFGGNGYIESIATDANGNVYAGGGFIDDSSKRYVAKWDGAAWTELGGVNNSPFNGVIYSIATDADGNVYAAGDFGDADSLNYIAKWNGTAWIKLRSDYFNGIVNSIAINATGNVYAGGSFSVNREPFVAKWDGASWSVLGGSNGFFTNSFNSAFIRSITIDADGNVYAGGAFTDANDNTYVAKYAQNTLPITLVNFTATEKNKDIVINWQSANEINTSYFNVQRSTDGRSFTNIGKIAAKGNSKVNDNYIYIDNKLSQLNANQLFYRLQEVDNDGKFNYSIIKTIELNNNSILFAISPNPAKDYINISSSGNVTNAQISVTELNGKVLYIAKQNFTANQQIKIPASQFAKQVLIITINTVNGKQKFKVVKE